MTLINVLICHEKHKLKLLGLSEKSVIGPYTYQVPFIIQVSKPKLRKVID